MKLAKFKKLINIENYAWLMACAKPFRGMIFFIVLIDVVTSVLGVGSAVISKNMVDYAIAGQASQAIIFICIFVGFQLFNLGISVVYSRIYVKLSEKMSYKMERDLIQKLYQSDWMALNGYHSGDILTRLTDDIDSVVSLWTSNLPGMFALGFQLILAFGILVYFDITLALLAFILGPLAVIISFTIGQKMKKLQHKSQAAESRYRSYITELVQHIVIIKSFQYEKESLNIVGERQNDKYDLAIKRNNLSVATKLVLSGGYYLGYVLAFVYGVFKIAEGKVSFGTFTAFLQLVNQIQGPIVGLTKSFSRLLSSFASVERLMELEGLDNETLGAKGIDYKEKQYGISSRSVTFSYLPDKKIIHEVSFKADPGKITALIGSSGEGKTTMMRLFLGLLKPSSGYISICADHQEDILVSAESRSYFTYVPQGNTLFSGTIAENLRVGKPNATQEELVQSLQAACAWDFVQALSNGIESKVGEAGLGISEGQAQRLCIARALIRTSPILLFDEATSALDMETEKKIFENIKKAGTKTCIAITHRLSVLPLCDKIYRLENGHVYVHETEEFTQILGHEMASN